MIVTEGVEGFWREQKTWRRTARPADLIQHGQVQH